MVRASVCGTEGCGFESHCPPQQRCLAKKVFIFSFEGSAQLILVLYKNLYYNNGTFLIMENADSESKETARA